MKKISHLLWPVVLSSRIHGIQVSLLVNIGLADIKALSRRNSSQRDICLLPRGDSYSVSRPAKPSIAVLVLCSCCGGFPSYWLLCYTISIPLWLYFPNPSTFRRMAVVGAPYQYLKGIEPLRSTYRLSYRQGQRTRACSAGIKPSPQSDSCVGPDSRFR